MHGVVYVDILVLVNAILAYFLLKATAFFAVRPQKPIRLCVAAFLAGLSALTLLLPPLATWFMAPIKLLCAFVVALAAFGFGGWRAFGKTVFWYITLNALLGGVVAAAVFYGANTMQYRNFSLYLHISPVLLIFCVLGTYAAVQLCSFVFGRPKPQQQTAFLLWITSEAPPVEGMALLDTGMHLKDAVTGKEAMLLSLPSVKTQLPEQTAAAVQSYFQTGMLAQHEPPLRLMAVKTATGMRVLPVLCGVRLTLRTVAKEKTFAAPLAAFSEETLADGSYQAVISPDYNETILKQTTREEQQ